VSFSITSSKLSGEIQHRIGAASAPRQVRRRATFHLSEEQFAAWDAAHGS
jgi:hypothetical protein